MRSIWGAIVMLCASAAQADADFADCAKFKTDVEFAACVDAHIGEISGQHSTVTTPAQPKPKPEKAVELPPPVGPGKWHFQTETSKIDDSQNVYLYLESEDVIVGDHRGATRPKLWVRCRENRTDAILDWDPFWFYSDHRVTTRIDKAKAQKHEWSASTDHVAVFHPSPIAYIRQLARGDHLVVQVSPINEPIHEAAFDLKGLRFYLPSLQRACHWS